MSDQNESKKHKNIQNQTEYDSFFQRNWLTDVDVGRSFYMEGVEETEQGP